MKIISVIPARGNSKSIKNKNIKLLNKVPLIKYSIDYSLRSSLINKTIVSTESQKIAKIANKYGAETPFLRNKKLSKDSTQDFPVMIDALLRCEKFYNTKFDLLVILRPTSPLRPKGLIEKSISLLRKNKNATSVRAVSSSNQHPFRQWKWKRNDKYIESFIPDNTYEPYNMPRQKLPSSFWQTGDIEVVRRKTLIAGSVSGNKVLPLIINHEDVFDIDTIKDFNKANKSVKKQ